jgi:hypothetical protein
MLRGEITDDVDLLLNRVKTASLYVRLPEDGWDCKVSAT